MFTGRDSNEAQSAKACGELYGPLLCVALASQEVHVFGVKSFTSANSQPPSGLYQARVQQRPLRETARTCPLQAGKQP